MYAAWAIGINLITKSNFGLVTNQMARQSTLAQARVSALTASTNRMATAAKAGISVFNTLSVAAAAATLIGIKGAADLQDAMAQTAVAMGRSTADIDRQFSGLALSMSNRTAQSVTQSMELIRTLATSGINDPKELRRLAMPIAMYADAQFLDKKTPFNTSAALAAKIAHQFGARSASDLAPILNSLWKMSQDMPDSIQSAATQLKYYAPAYRAAGVSPQEILMLQATADRMGYGSGKSGTGLNMMLRNLVSPSGPKMLTAQEALGISGFAYRNERTGLFNVEGLLNHLNDVQRQYTASGRAGDFGPLIANAFSSNAGLIAQMFSSDAGRAQYAAVRATMARVHDLNVAQPQLLDTLNNQTKRLATNFQSLATILEKPFIGNFTSAVGKLADVLGNWTDWFSKHPHAAAAAGAAVTAAGAYGAHRVIHTGRMALRAFTQAGGAHLGVTEYGLGRGAAAAGEGIGILGAVRLGAGSLMANSALGGLVTAVGAGMRGVGAQLMRGFGTFMAESGFAETFASIRGIGGVLAKFGLRGIPIIGELLLLRDAIGLLQHSMPSLGYAIGYSARWMVTTGGPMLANAFKSGFTLLIPAAKDGFISLLNALSQILSPQYMAKIGFDMGKSLVANIISGWTHGPGAPAVPAPSPSGAKAVKGGHVVAMEFHYHASPGDDATQRRHALEAHRRIAADTAGVLASASRTITRAAGSVISSATMSAYETAAGTA